jgi:hypothetical protein
MSNDFLLKISYRIPITEKSGRLNPKKVKKMTDCPKLEPQKPWLTQTPLGKKNQLALSEELDRTVSSAPKTIVKGWAKWLETPHAPTSALSKTPGRSDRNWLQGHNQE